MPNIREKLLTLVEQGNKKYFDPTVPGTRCSIIADHLFANGVTIQESPGIQVIPVETVSAYLQQKLDEWEALGDRKWDPMNAWGYNFLRACQDDLEKYVEGSNET